MNGGLFSLVRSFPRRGTGWMDGWMGVLTAGKSRYQMMVSAAFSHGISLEDGVSKHNSLEIKYQIPISSPVTVFVGTSRAIWFCGIEIVRSELEGCFYT
jgi:hypothetical protein